MTKRFSGASKLLALGLCVAAAVAMPLSASADGWGGHGGYGHGWGGGYGHGWGSGYGHGWGDGYGHGYGGGYGRGGGHWSGGNWIAGALLTGAVVGLVANSYQRAPVYYQPAPAYYGSSYGYGQRVVYSQPGNVVYSDGAQTQIITRTTTYSQPTQYVRDDGYYGN